jgi:NADH:ubiquinone oxidoreductase subunit 5 (subunit L)/multisubunit Na+/H+ antiporter MnhA subunit
MLVLVLGANFPVMFVGWEGVGLCSYLLIGFWFQKKSASDAGKKAFVVNRIGDFGFILAMLLIFATFGTLDFQAVAEAASGRRRKWRWGSSPSSRCCSSSGPPASRRRSRSTSGCRTRWKARRRSPP